MSSKSIYSSPLCSCIICRKEFSAKGIHSHVRIAHTANGAMIHSTNRNPEKCSITIKNKAYERNITLCRKYYSSPNICKCCGKSVDWFRRNNRFCSQNCAASYTNKTRNPLVKEKQKATLKKTLAVKPKIVNPTKKISLCYFSYCKICNCVIRNKNTKTCSADCYGKLLSNLASVRMTHPQNGKTVTYNGIKLGSSYELVVAIDLDANNIKWTKPKPLYYTDRVSGKIKRYFPDFFLPEYNVYLDPKNDFLINHINPETGYRDLDKILWAEEENSVRIMVLNKKQLNWEFIRNLLSEMPESNRHAMKA